ncbi:hypothetical protein Pelo_6090 [Pelomyxa schiedti]|nr:hypothetical protein Pelo_6090 [Pelomyxa schiedti]
MIQVLQNFYHFTYNRGWNPGQTKDAGWLTMKAICEILSGHAMEDCVTTLCQALEVAPFFSPALLVLYYLSFNKQHMRTLHEKGIHVALLGKVSLTPTYIDLAVLGNDCPNRVTIPELVLKILWTRHISCDFVAHNHNMEVLLTLL